MAIYIGVAGLTVAIGLAVFVATRSDRFRVERSALVGAPADVVFSIIHDLRNWRRWSPYEERDPNMKTSIEGTPPGPGSMYNWDGDGQVGSGRLTILDSEPNERISMRLEIYRPFACDNRVTYLLVPEEGGTRVSWILEGEKNFMAKAMHLVMDMDKMVGKDFELGLAKLDVFAAETAQGEESTKWFSDRSSR